MVDPSANDGGKKNEELSQFDVVTDHSDHYFLKAIKDVDVGVGGGGGGNCFTNGSSKVYKKIMQEWKILEKNLPETITVRVYEQRIDLLRAAIVGAAGTPYHDGLFFFDLQFPFDYPNRPPKVYYRSFGLRLNPNLYANGRVCLSLLNTWSGNTNQKWNPSESTVLQVLVSIQGLVLNEKPFHNEPGFGGWTGRALFEKSARVYNEQVFALSCKTVIFLLRKPPKNFEAFVAQHFRNHGNAILRACKAYLNGQIIVGCYRDDGSSSSSNSSSVIKVSRTFKTSMGQIYPQLVTAFTNTGASLENFVKHVEIIEKTKHWIPKKIMDKIKKILGLKKANAKP